MMAVSKSRFGIAQAVTASTITYNNGSLLPVHYFSPNRHGGLTDEKSDLYSRIVLFEMLTGGFLIGESPVSIALNIYRNFSRLD